MATPLALVVEEGPPCWKIESMEDVYKILNPDFGDLLIKLFNDYGKVEDLVFAMDLLSDMMETPYFPSDRLLDSQDITVADGRVLNRIGIITENKTMCGVVVTQQLAALIEEFLEDSHINIIHSIITKTRTPFMTFIMSGVTYELLYYTQLGTMSHIDCIRLTKSDKPGVILQLPFNNKRVSCKA